jgi:hypothetical protein
MGHRIRHHDFARIREIPEAGHRVMLNTGISTTQSATTVLHKTTWTPTGPDLELSRPASSDVPRTTALMYGDSR